MPIASKLIYFQRERRPSPVPPDPEPEPPDPRRRPCRDRSRRRSALSSHHKSGQEVVPGNHQRDAVKPLGFTGAITEHAPSSARLNRSVSDHGRLPDAVQQARERLLQRLNSVDLSGRSCRHKKTWPSESVWADGSTHPANHSSISTTTSTESSSSILGSLTSCFIQPAGESAPSCKVHKETTSTAAEAIVNADQRITLFPQPAVPAGLQHADNNNISESEEEEEEESEEEEEEGGEEHSKKKEPCSAECCICLEWCDDADGLIRLRCKHVFHSTCLERWLRSHGDCPYCRASVLVL